MSSHSRVPPMPPSARSAFMRQQVFEFTAGDFEDDADVSLGAAG
jgi:hypothetical protein